MCADADALLLRSWLSGQTCGEGLSNKHVILPAGVLQPLLQSSDGQEGCEHERCEQDQRDKEALVVDMSGVVEDDVGCNTDSWPVNGAESKDQSSMTVQLNSHHANGACPADHQLLLQQQPQPSDVQHTTQQLLQLDRDQQAGTATQQPGQHCVQPELSCPQHLSWQPASTPVPSDATCNCDCATQQHCQRHAALHSAAWMPDTDQVAASAGGDSQHSAAAPVALVHSTLHWRLVPGKMSYLGVGAIPAILAISGRECDAGY